MIKVYIFNKSKDILRIDIFQTPSVYQLQHICLHCRQSPIH